MTTPPDAADVPLPGMPTPSGGSVPEGVEANEEIPARRRGVASTKDARRSRQRPADPRRRELTVRPGAAHAQFVLRVMQAATHACAGRVASLRDDAHHMLAVTFDGRAYELTSESLVDPPWTSRVRDVLDRLTE